MARKKLKCSKCKRTFSMPAHLARHMNTIHRRGKIAAAKPTKGKVGRPKGRPRATTASRAGASAGGAANVIAAMTAYHGELVAERSSLDNAITTIATAMDAMGGTGAPARKRGRKPGRPPGRPAAKRGRAKKRKAGRPAGGGRGLRAGSLPDFVIKTLSATGRPMSPADIASEVVKAGYKTKSKDLAKAVSNALPNLRRIKKTGRGMYSA